MDDFAKQYQSLLSSPLGVDMLAELRKEHDSSVEKAERSTDPNTAFGLLKEASGVIKAIDHLHFLAHIAPKDEGNKGL